MFDLEQVDRSAKQRIGSIPASPFNVFGDGRRLAGPEERFVSINNHTVYSVANVDVSGGPVRFDVPDSHGRY